MHPPRIPAQFQLDTCTHFSDIFVFTSCVPLTPEYLHMHNFLPLLCLPLEALYVFTKTVTTLHVQTTCNKALY